MKLSLRELAEAREALSCAFEQLWPDAACPCAKAKPPCLQEIAALEQRYHRAKLTALTETGTAIGTGIEMPVYS